VPSPVPAAAPVDVAAAVGQLRIALVNDVEFHHEVTLGLMAALQKHRERLTVSCCAAAISSLYLCMYNMMCLATAGCACVELTAAGLLERPS
jgi:hypothetical protein